jgi:hypothetical protein
LADYFFTPEGDLAGIVLKGAFRFDRDDYRDHKKADLDNAVKQSSATPKFTKERDEYWRPIPGAIAFYIPKEKISNINVRHVTQPADVFAAAEKRLAARNIRDYVISTPTQTSSETVSDSSAAVSTNSADDKSTPKP